MAMWSEELRRLTLFDGEAELTPESRPVWQQNMELRTKFVRYPGPKPDGLHPTHFWFLEHYGLLPYFLQMPVEGIPAKVFFSIVSTCRYVTVAERTEHLELRGLTGRKLVVSPEVMRKPLASPRDAAHNEEQGAAWPNQIINDYLLCKASSGPTPSRRYNLPAVSTFLRLTCYRLVNWAHMLAGGLASAVKEYVRKFSGGPGEAVVMVSWAPALMKIIKHNRALLFDSPLDCPEPWEVYTDCSGSYEQADVLRGVHSRRAVAKDALPRTLRLRPEERIENASQQAPAQPSQGRDEPRHHPRHRRRETQTATRPTRITRTTAEPEVGVVPSRRGKSRKYQAVAPKQPPRKEPRVGEPPQQSKGRQGDTAIPGFEPSDDELPMGTLRRDISRLRQEGQRTEPLVIRETGGRQALNGSRQKAIEQIPLPPPGQKKKKNKTPAVQPGPERNSSAKPRLENNTWHRQPLKRSARTSDHAIPMKRFRDFTLSCLYSSGQHPRPPAFLNRSRWGRPCWTG
ncbi:hypothetical protein R1flu_004850 [Riccia fluitans]|uniref:Aminotransferase-like plant mobile domain-containing protein n=1 Tax=Riccia fluitans TaxID=41844 RepID=A0ABD1YRG6_9MARC